MQQPKTRAEAKAMLAKANAAMGVPTFSGSTLDILKQARDFSFSRHGALGEDGLGNCHVIAYETAVFCGRAVSQKVRDGIRLCEGTAYFPLHDRRSHHGWVEFGRDDERMVIDGPTGKVMTQAEYYAKGQVADVHRYTYNEAIDLAVKEGTYGPFSDAISEVE